MHTKALSFVEGNAQDLNNFEDNSFDLYTIAFGLRNVTDVVSEPALIVSKSIFVIMLECVGSSLQL